MSGKMIVAGLLAVISLACVGDASTEPGTVDPPEDPVTPVVDVIAAAGIDDAIDRLLPGLDEDVQRRARPLLRELALSVGSADRGAQLKALERWESFESTLPAVVTGEPDYMAVRHAVRTAMGNS